MNPHPRTVEDVISDFKGRRAAIIRALTIDVDQFHQLCNPNFQSLSLYAFPDQQWQVNPPSPNWELPEPRLGINLARDSMNNHDWLSMVALHSDAWLHSVASYYAAKLKFDKADRKRLLNQITDVCSVSEAMISETRKHIVAVFPEELLFEVLSRVPVRDLLKYRSVCKRWCSLIDNPEFVSAHLRNYNTNCDESNLLVIKLELSFIIRQILVRRSDTFRKVMELEHGLNDVQKVQFSCHTYHNLGYVNGVMLMRKKRSRVFDHIILWNPSIGKSLHISNSALKDLRVAKFFEVGLGFDASNNDLKVVAIVYPHVEVNDDRTCYCGTVPGVVHVYTLSTKSWSSYNGVHPPPYWSTGAQVFVNGGVHWTNLGPEIRKDGSWREMRDSHIVSFDMSNKVFNYFELPSEVVEDRDGEKIRNKFPIVLEGLLGMFYSYESHNEVWVMEEYGVPNSWNKRYKFELQNDNLLHFRNNGELLFAYKKAIKSYDVKSNSAKDLGKAYYSKSIGYRIYTYVESLLLACK